MSALLDNLNSEQLAAVTLPAQHALVLAGAGSGKTRVLTTRIAWLVQTSTVSPSGLLAVTFTNKAAREMMVRIGAMLPINIRGMWIGTFHGLCNRLLRAHFRDANLPQTFQILDSQDQLSLLKRVMKGLGVDEDRFPPKQVQYFINAAKEEGRRAGKVEVYDDFTRRNQELYAAYDEQCQKEGVVDFPELLLRSFELLSNNELLRNHYQARFRHVLVDEFQDTNRLQYRWLRLLVGQHNVMFAVGDDDQSIYRFRGANVGNMADFERDYRVENIIRLEQNYRSYGNILKAANTLIAHNKNRLGKNLWTEAGEGEPIRVFEASSDAEEARWLVEEVKSLINEGQARRDVAVLYRSNAQSRVVEHALFSAGLPYKVYGGLRFFERMEVKHALAYLRLVANSDDDGAFLRVVNFPTRGIGARSIEAVQDAAVAAGSSLWQAVGKLSGKTALSVGAFVTLINALRTETQGLPLQEAVQVVIEKSGLIAHYKAEREGADRIENLNELVNAAAVFVQEEDENDLTAFLSHASLESGDNQAAEGADAVQLMTTHSAKGLEFHTVFVTGMEEGLFPHEQSLNEDDGLEEERRLMYVAITRARTRLYFSFAQTRMLHGQTRFNVASRFLDEVPGGLLKWISARYAAKRPSDDAWKTGEPAPNRRASRDTGIPFRIGQSVAHPKFGQGVIVNAEGSGGEARVQINFGKQGMKWLALEFAKLERV